MSSLFGAALRGTAEGEETIKRAANSIRGALYAQAVEKVISRKLPYKKVSPTFSERR